MIPATRSRGGRQPIDLLLAASGRHGDRHFARNPKLNARNGFLAEALPRRHAARFMSRVVSRLVPPEFLVVIEIVVAKA
jgi:hypothetical protein